MRDEAYENDEEVDAYDEAVTGSWSQAEHIGFCEGASEKLNSEEIKILKKGAKYPDTTPY